MPVRTTQIAKVTSPKCIVPVIRESQQRLKNASTGCFPTGRT